ncbi:FAD-binding and (Fe-S)-binding domain-containing protein [Cryobacterium roopkundense]|uniref:FAD/FMN-containing dehydrogenase/Fe-S oxidoreductase n=1 Tax=Cryobacterium roopkundense TaxID=1001240 RepID=A0A7W8ZZS7_9MICO|nr:FAD-binding and (Fe-S)-binding domain-containing protein [Cryobacterium roopkundense]MBB5643211.1 FAD/FMN-containing dehydrogenase/Fe-S oxidoreductase [Cryobacterium roopkundense]
MTDTAAGALVALRARGIEVDTTSRRRSEYAYDASNYRIEPLGVIFPRDAAEVARVLETCHTCAVPVVPRGGGTSMAGGAVGPGIVLDFSRHMAAVLNIDAGAREATAEAGIVLTTFQREVERASDGALTFAPDPSSKSRATLGGSIANDACGNHSVRDGRTSDHVISLDVVTAEGLRLTATRSGLEATVDGDEPARARAVELTAELRSLVSASLSDFRLELGRIPRQVSGFHLSHLLPENGFDVARSLVGSEGTCVIVVSATVKLVPTPGAALLLSLGYDDVVDAAKDIMTILEFSPAAVEGIDEAIVDTMRHRRGPDSVVGLPTGRAWLYVDLDGDNLAEVTATAERLLVRLRENGRLVDGRVVPNLEERASLWRVREDGAGLSARLHTGGESWPGWEDSAVAPENLAAYLADFRDLLARFDLQGVLYGHFGAGCMHVRITFDLRTDAGRAVMDAFMRAAARLVVTHGGSLSGEHGDGRARSELLPLMYSPAMLAAFDRFKRVWDSRGILNPGVLVQPDSFMDNLALSGIPEREWRTSFDLTPVTSAPAGHGLDPFVHAVQACVGIGRCRSDAGGVMCPSFRATGDEKDSTRGRSRVLQDMVRGATSVEKGWRSEDVREALDLCLSCKACSTDCPVGVDMATYKSEFFSNFYRRRLRPMSHYSLGWLPTWLKLTVHVAPLLNLVLSTPLRRVVAVLGGLTTKRALPKFASAAQLRRELPPMTAPRAAGPADIVLVVDSFTKGFRPEVAGAAQRVLGAAGKTVECNADVCCGLTLISTGQLDKARKLLTRAAVALDDGSDAPIVVIEPSCAAAFKKDLPELIHTDAARRVSRRIRSFAGMVTELAQAGWQPNWPDGAVPPSVTVQTHCHEYSVFGAASQTAALRAVGVASVREATGCCGVAGNFGFEPSHFDISMQVAEQALIPALRQTDARTPVLADGFSCQMQIMQLDAQRTTLHLAELLDGSAPHEFDNSKGRS